MAVLHAVGREVASLEVFSCKVGLTYILTYDVVTHTTPATTKDDHKLCTTILHSTTSV